MAKRYEILDLLATGGMAEIYRARTIGAEGFKKPVVVKKILPTYTRDPEFVRMFVEEAKLAAELHHGNIVQVHDLGATATGETFIVMELVHGHDLGDLLHDAGRQEIPLGFGEAIFIARQVCRGLDYAHRKLGPDGETLGIIHRDVSPQNVLISFEGEVKLTDFGIAKARTRTQETQVGFLKGKYGYMSPEQARGEPLDQRSDLFNVGILLYEMLAGERLFQGSNDFSTLNQMRNVEMVPLERLREGLPSALVEIVHQALAPDPVDRFESAAQLDKTLARLAFENSLTITGADLSRFMERVYGRPAAGPGKLTATRVIDLEALPGVVAMRGAAAELAASTGTQAWGVSPGAVSSGALRDPGGERPVSSRPPTVSIQPARPSLLPPKAPPCVAQPLPPWARGGALLLLTGLCFALTLGLTLRVGRDEGTQTLPVQGLLETRELRGAKTGETSEALEGTLPRWLLVRARPAGSTVLLDAEVRARATPALLEIPAGRGERALRVEHTAHRPFRGEVAEPAEQTLSEVEVVEVVLLPRLHPVTVRTRPSRANLMLDGKSLGQSPRTFKVRPGLHRLVARRRGRLPVSAEIEGGQTRRLELTLPRRGETGRLKVLTYPAATVRVGPRVIEAGEKGVDLHLPAGRYRLALSAPSLPDRVLHVEVERASTTRLFVDLMLSSRGP